MKKIITTNSAEETTRIGRILGKYLAKGDCIPLIGEMGSGKTCFVQGVARGVGVPDETPVNSPSFTLVNRYDGDITLYHMDLFRLDSDGELVDLEVEELVHGDGITLIEWPQILIPHVQDVVMTILFFWDMTSEYRREITFQTDNTRFDTFFKELCHVNTGD